MIQRSKFSDTSLMTFGGHLEVLRQMLFRIIFIVILTSIFVFCSKDITFEIMLAPSDSNFITYRTIERLVSQFNINFHFEDFSIDLITTEISSQFMTHFLTSVYLGTLLASPYILFEVFRFVMPALYKNERKASWGIIIIMYPMFLLGLAICYYIIFPFSVRFLGTYQVASKVHSTITLDSYLDTFFSLSLVMGIIFQLPVVSYILARKDFVAYEKISIYRRHALVMISIIAAVITPPDVMTLLLVAIPLYLLFEISLWIIKVAHKNV